MTELTSTEELKRLIESQFNELKEFIETQLKSQQELLEQTFQEVNRIKRFLGTMPSGQIGFSSNTGYPANNLASSLLDPYSIDSSTESFISKNFQSSNNANIAENETNQNSTAVLQDIDSTEDIKDYLRQITQNMSEKSLKTQKKTFRSVNQLEQQLKDDFKHEDWENFFYTASLIFNAIFSYLGLFFKKSSSEPKDSKETLSSRWQELSVFPLPIQSQTLVFLDDIIDQLQKGKGLMAKGKTASKILENITQISMTFNQFFYDL